MIRAATLTDAAAISELVRRTVREHVAPTLSETGLQNLLSKMDESSIVSYFNDGFRFFVAQDERDLIGVTAVIPPTHLFYLFVETHAQRMGTGRRLWTHARDWLLREHAPETITVNSSLNAITIYQKFGFEIEGDVIEQNEVRYQPMCWHNRQRETAEN